MTDTKRIVFLTTHRTAVIHEKGPPMDVHDATTGLWRLATHGPCTITAPDGTTRILLLELRLAFSSSGTQALELLLDDTPLLTMVGPATADSFRGATIRTLQHLLAQTPTPPEQ